MPISQVGDEAYPITKKIGGQEVRFYEEYFALILEDDYYRKAGKNQSNGGHWPKKVEDGELGIEGISINTSLYKAVMKNRDKDFIVYNKKRDEFYRLDHYNIVVDNVGMEERYGRKLAVTPLDAYTKVFRIDEIDSKLKELKSN